MAKILDMPKLSPTMEEGVLQAWHKNEGDAVAVDDLLAEVETDKATMEFRAFDKGTILKILVPAGSNVKLGQPVAILGDPGEDVSALVAKAGGAAAAQPKRAEEPPPTPGGAEAAQEQRGRVQTIEARTQTIPPATSRTPQGPATPKTGSVLTRTERDVAAPSDGDANGGRVIASPYVRKVARERGIDLQSAQGSGDHGRILPADLDTLATRAPLARSTSTAIGAPALAQPEARPLSPMRKTIARRLAESKRTVPHFYLTIDVDAEPLAALRERINGELVARGGRQPSPDSDEKPFKVSLNDLLIKAVAGALVRVPECNAQFTEEALLIHRRVDISVAVAIPDGLVTPVVRNADQKSVVAIAREVRDLAARARTKKLKPEEFTDGTFSISNLGMFGIDEFSAVINPPEGAILAVGQVRDEPVVKDGVVKPGKKLAMTLSCDHRVIDGAIGAAFLAELRALVEHPMRILTG
ncbi:MAG TPA: dihydrolipoamide acetyltransferase family protein [Labilithrix sp.]|jgi:pyruvate dehydrogenase E2 component (dihydrolipoamide acetyltransferase)